jgi:hypothetical protein
MALVVHYAFLMFLRIIMFWCLRVESPSLIWLYSYGASHLHPIFLHFCSTNGYVGLHIIIVWIGLYSVYTNSYWSCLHYVWRMLRLPDICDWCCKACEFRSNPVSVDCRIFFMQKCLSFFFFPIFPRKLMLLHPYNSFKAWIH